LDPRVHVFQVGTDLSNDSLGGQSEHVSTGQTLCQYLDQQRQNIHT